MKLYQLKLSDWEQYNYNHLRVCSDPFFHIGLRIDSVPTNESTNYYSFDCFSPSYSIPDLARTLFDFWNEMYGEKLFRYEDIALAKETVDKFIIRVDRLKCFL